MTTTLHATPDPDRPLNVDLQPPWARPVIEFLQHAAEQGYSVELTAKLETLTPAEVAARLGISRATISRRIRAGEIKSIMVGNRHRIPLQEVDRYRDHLTREMANYYAADIDDDLIRG